MHIYANSHIQLNTDKFYSSPKREKGTQWHLEKMSTNSRDHPWLAKDRRCKGCLTLPWKWQVLCHGEACEVLFSFDEKFFFEVNGNVSSRFCITLASYFLLAAPTNSRENRCSRFKKNRSCGWFRGNRFFCSLTGNQISDIWNLKQ